MVVPARVGDVIGNVTGTSLQPTTFRLGTGTLAARGAAVTAPTGGSVIDIEGRAAINALISRLQAFGLIS
jgi:hypothetical protein